jgi:hypothetical protein
VENKADAIENLGRLIRKQGRRKWESRQYIDCKARMVLLATRQALVGSKAGDTGRKIGNLEARQVVLGI